MSRVSGHWLSRSRRCRRQILHRRARSVNAVNIAADRGAPECNALSRKAALLFPFFLGQFFYTHCRCDQSGATPVAPLGIGSVTVSVTLFVAVIVTDLFIHSGFKAQSVLNIYCLLSWERLEFVLIYTCVAYSTT